MRFGLSLSGMLQHTGDGDMVQRFKDCVSLVNTAREAGFDYVYSGHHYLSHPYQTLQPLPSLARLAAETGDMRILSTVLVSLANPVQLAEEVATLDVITGGKMTIAAALGYRDEEYEAFGVTHEDRIARMFENLELMHELWKGGEVTYHGRFTQVTGVHTGVKPIQQPPPVWVAANGDGMVRRIARRGLTWYLNPHGDAATMQRQLAMWKEVRAEHGHPEPAVIPMGRECYVAATREQAWETAAPFLGAKYETYSAWGQDKAMPGEEDFTVPFEQLAAGRFIIGSPEDVIRDLRPFQEAGVTHVSLRLGWPGTPKEVVEQAVKLAGAEVIPAFR